ncbi:MAG: hypothetical protein ACYSU0_18535 [Planctomycetota bacterium]|jgi:hypothetical protein
MMIYLGIAFAVGIICGVVHNIILWRRILPYLRNRGIDCGGLLGVFRFHKALAEYFRIDDPTQKGTKLLLRCLRIPFVVAWLIVVFFVVSAWRHMK